MNLTKEYSEPTKNTESSSFLSRIFKIPLMSRIFTQHLYGHEHTVGLEIIDTLLNVSLFLGDLWWNQVKIEKTGEQRFNNNNNNQHKGRSKSMIVFEI